MTIRPTLTLLLALVPAPVLAQSGFRFAVATGIHSPLTQLSPTNPVGFGVELAPEWRSQSGLGLGAGFRYIGYQGVPDHRALHVEVRKYFAGQRAQPLLGLRLTGFVGGDEEGDDPYIGLGLGPVGGVELPLGDRAAVQIVGSVLAVQALFRSSQVMAGLQVGIVIR